MDSKGEQVQIRLCNSDTSWGPMVVLGVEGYPPTKNINDQGGDIEGQVESQPTNSKEVNNVIVQENISTLLETGEINQRQNVNLNKGSPPTPLQTQHTLEKLTPNTLNTIYDGETSDSESNKDESVERDAQDGGITTILRMILAQNKNISKDIKVQSKSITQQSKTIGENSKVVNEKIQKLNEELMEKLTIQSEQLRESFTTQNYELKQKMTGMDANFTKLAGEVKNIKQKYVPIIEQNTIQIETAHSRIKIIEQEMRTDLEKVERVQLDLQNEVQLLKKTITEEKGISTIQTINKVDNTTHDDNYSILTAKNNREEDLLEKLVNIMTNNSSSKSLLTKINSLQRLPTFNGVNYTASDFLNQVETYYAMADITKDIDKVTAFSTLITGKAMRWFTAIKEGVQTWVELKEKFKANFQSTFSMKEKFREWKEMEIGSEMDLEDHMLKGLQIQTILYPDTNFDERAQRVMKRLPSKVKENMRLKLDKYTDQSQFFNNLRAVLTALDRTYYEEEKYHNPHFFPRKEETNTSLISNSFVNPNVRVARPWAENRGNQNRGTNFQRPTGGPTNSWRPQNGPSGRGSAKVGMVQSYDKTSNNFVNNMANTTTSTASTPKGPQITTTPTGTQSTIPIPLHLPTQGTFQANTAGGQSQTGGAAQPTIWYYPNHQPQPYFMQGNE